MKDIEELLRRHQPAAPPAALRARVVRAREDRQGRNAWAVAREWIPAAAAALFAITCYARGAHARADASARLAPIEASRAEAVSLLTTALGGDDFARLEAERLIQEADRAAAQQPLPTTDPAIAEAGTHD